MKRALLETLDVLQFAAIRQFLAGMVLAGAVTVPLVVYALWD